MLQRQRQGQPPEIDQAVDAVAQPVVSGPLQQEHQMSAEVPAGPQEPPPRQDAQEQEQQTRAVLQQESQTPAEMPADPQELPPQQDEQEQEQPDDLLAADAMAMAEVERMLAEFPEAGVVHPFNSFGDEPWDFTWPPSDSSSSDPVDNSATSRSEPPTPPSPPLPLPLLHRRRSEVRESPLRPGAEDVALPTVPDRPLPPLPFGRPEASGLADD